MLQVYPTTIVRLENRSGKVENNKCKSKITDKIYLNK